MSLFENPPLLPSDNYVDRSYVQLYIPLDPRIKQFMATKKVESLLHLLDETLFEGSSLSEEEKEVVDKEVQGSKQAELQQNLIMLDDAEKLASLHSFIAELKSKSSLPGKSSNPCLPSPEQSIIRHRYRCSSSSSVSSARSSSRNKSSRRPTSTRNSSKQRTSPSRSFSSDRRYSRPSKSSFRSPSRSPTTCRSKRHHKSSKYSSRRHSSPHRRSPSWKPYSSSRGSPPSLSPSPARSSRHHKSYGKSSKLFTSSCMSPMGERSLSPPDRYISSRHAKKSYNCSRSPSLDKRSKHPESRFSRSPIRQRRISCSSSDDYDKLLAEEIEKRCMYKGSGSQAEQSKAVLVQDTEKQSKATVAQDKGKQNKTVLVLDKDISENNEPIYNTKDLFQDEQNLEEEESELVNAEILHKDPNLPQRRIIKEETKSEFNDQKGFFNTFYCPSCQLSLNSESTWQSHINGKKHAKVLKLQTVHEVAKGSIAIPSNPALALEDAPRFAKPPAGFKHIRVRDVPRLQPAIDNCAFPLLGLQSVKEIRAPKEVHYYCELCDAPCSAHSIMPHLTGYNHQRRFLKEIDPVCYEKNKLVPKKQFEPRLSAILSNHERKFGRGEIKVFEEREDSRAMPTSGMYSQPGPSSRGNFLPIKVEKDLQADIPPNDECLDISKADFHCKICDSHMNGLGVWEAHVRGKRHLTNAKKIPGENVSKVRSVKAPPNVRSVLERLLRENARDEIIVGLDFIRETQGPNGEIYNCFLCGSCCTNFDIVNHLLLTKHRIRYLEKMIADGRDNGITTISQIDMQHDYFRNSLIEEQCLKMVEEYGSGKVEVYLSKCKFKYILIFGSLANSG